MIKFVSEEGNSKAVYKVLSGKKPLRCAVAFWGESAWEFFKQSNQIVKIICNLESGATNPFLIKKLLAKKNFQIKTKENLHAKVYLTECRAIVGSSNVSANGLSLEDEEIRGYIEASIVTNDKNVLKSIGDWFESQWESACEITDELLEQSEKRWRNRRISRLNKIARENKKISLLEALKNNAHIFKNRNIFLFIYRLSVSPEAMDKFSEVKKKMQSSSSSILDFYEDGSELPENSHLIDIYYGPKGGFKYDGIFQTPINHLIEKFEYEDGEEGEIIICFRSDSVMGYKISKKDKELLRSKISDLWESEYFWRCEDDRSGCLSLYDAKSCLF